MESGVELCVLVPLFNEAENVLPLSQEILTTLARQSRSFTLLFVDDASQDDTWERIQEAHRLDARVKGIRHARNAGQSAALWTGIQNCQSPLIATLDGDRQNDPADLIDMLQQLENFDFVSGKRTRRQDSWVRKVSSQIARVARRIALGADFQDTGCALRVFRREVLAGLFGFNGLHRFLPVLVHREGFRTAEVPVSHRPRVAGVSKYGVWNRLWRGIVDLFAMAWYQRRRLPRQERLDRVG